MIYNEALSGSLRPSKIDEIRIASILRKTLKLENKNTKVKGQVLRRWKMTDKTYEIIKNITSDFKEF